MTYFYPLLLYLGVGGSLALLGIGSIPRLRALRKPVSAVWVTALALIWLLSPSTGRWILSVWSPTDVVGGLLVLDMAAPIWWSVLLLLAAAGGALWVSAGERADDASLIGVLLLVLLTVTWLGLASGSVLMTLAMWTVFDVIWFLSRLMGGSDGERAVWASALNGGASLLLWAVSLLLLRDGDSGLWWLMRPSESVRALLLVAAYVRIGFYPFQIVHAETLRHSRLHALMSVLNPLMGIALLYRLVSLPEVYGLPNWVVGWSCLSVLWSGLKAFSLRRRATVLPAGFGLLLAAVTGAVVTLDGELLMIGAGVWVASMALLLISKRVGREGALLSWPTFVGAALLIGIPISPMHSLYTAAFSSVPWGWRLGLLVGLTCLATSLLRGLQWRAVGRLWPAWPRLTVSVVGGHLVVIGALAAAAFYAPIAQLEPVPFLLWFLAAVVGALFVRWGHAAQRVWRRGQPLIQLLDLQWLYRAMWQGSQHLLSVLRVTAEVVEGSGSVLWSVLILLLIALILGGR